MDRAGRHRGEGVAGGTGDPVAVYADPGYLPDGDPRLRLDSATAAVRALEWVAGPHGNRYTATQRKRIRKRIRRYLADLGE